ncbi:murein hydrolase activator EnvC [Variovorax sp. OV329]|uniref:murein hydrolase activator EnvC family protein n=1 Tax=Variovorax sp. OV329 TaxID=1882825 RepID=UPI0008EB1A36|nr:M23 family metallopeptidase [Variovorax sp. OV329]SFL94714.1 lipoprotein NlpD [Variovorax sp. OV329]
MQPNAVPFASSTFRGAAVLVLVAAAALSACTSTPLTSPPSSATPQPAPVQSRFIRPANGATLARFDGKGNKGIDIAGKPGDPVMASAAGKVVYVGDELRNYGNLVIVDHGNDFLTAYAYAQVVLVQEKQSVSQGQKIAEMGKNPNGTPMLHFEIRKQGVAVDPDPYLSGKIR